MGPAARVIVILLVAAAPAAAAPPRHHATMGLMPAQLAGYQGGGAGGHVATGSLGELHGEAGHFLLLG